MGQKTNPIAFRLGYIRGWDSTWFGTKKDFAAKIKEDHFIRNYVRSRIETPDDARRKGKIDSGISRIVIERTLNRLTVTICTSKPGRVIGKGGEKVDAIRQELSKATKKDVQINIYDVKNPDTDANIVADNICRQLENRVNYRRAIKMAIQNASRKSEGIKVKIAGRINGREMANTEEFKDGKTPLHTLRADIDYAWKEAQTVYGKLGIKVWICKGKVYEKRSLTPDFSSDKGGNKGRGGRRGGRNK